MSGADSLFATLSRFLPVLIVVALTGLGLWLASWLMLGRGRAYGADQRLPRQLSMLALSGVGLVVVVLALPVGGETRGQLLGLLGLVVTSIIALSSTTFVANAMAGLMLRAVGSFRPGDFVRIADEFGRVTERGLFHTEIQTEDSELTTLPNLYLLSHPVTVVRSSGTIVSATVSLGYDVAHEHVEGLLEQAARDAGLAEPFVQVRELGDFSVTYRTAGLLANVTQFLTVRSTLRRKMLDTLHDAGVEIVSPAFMAQRRLSPDAPVIPPPAAPAAPITDGTGPGPEDLIFDKAKQAGQREQLRVERDRLATELEEFEARRGEASEDERRRLEQEIETRRHQQRRIEVMLETSTDVEESEEPPIA